MICMLATWAVVGCEDLEDTYDEFTGDGRIRYLGKCTNVEALPGWKRIRVVWKTNGDAAVKHTKITWQSELDAQPFVRLVEREPVTSSTNLLDTVYLENLQDALYTVTISNVGADTSWESMSESQYVRPYTETHEDLRSFSRGIANFYPLGDKMAVVLDEDNENLHKMEFHFLGTDGEEHVWNIQEGMNASVSGMRDYMQLLPAEEGLGIDFSKPMTVNRIGRLSECLDEIIFTPEILSLDERSMFASFTTWLNKNYGPDWESSDVLSQIETVEFDYDMTTFQDLLYLPNVKKVILGKNRFMAVDHLNENLSTTDTYKALATLQFLKDTRPDFSVECYNDHYFDESIKTALEEGGKIDPDLIKKHEGGSNLALMPQVELLDVTGWEVTCSDPVYSGNSENGAGWLLDGDANTCFEPGQTLGATVFEVKIDMQEAHTLHGFKVQQPYPGTERDLIYLLSSVQIEVSEDGYVWQPATYEEGGISIGDAIGEITFIPVPEELQSRNIRYIRLTMANHHVGDISGGTPLFSLRLGDFLPY